MQLVQPGESASDPVRKKRGFFCNEKCHRTTALRMNMPSSFRKLVTHEIHDFILSQLQWLPSPGECQMS